MIKWCTEGPPEAKNIDKTIQLEEEIAATVALSIIHEVVTSDLSVGTSLMT